MTRRDLLQQMVNHAAAACRDLLKVTYEAEETPLSGVLQDQIDRAVENCAALEAALRAELDAA